jgi:large subunit ribosomal protein L21
MYAVIGTGGKQYKVSPGDVVRVESLEAKKGDTLDIMDVYMIADGDKISVGKPKLATAKVTVEVVDEDRGEKLLIFKHRRRKGYRKTIGHRQNYTAIKIKEITPKTTGYSEDRAWLIKRSRQFTERQRQ